GDVSNSWHHPGDNPPSFAKTYMIYQYATLGTASNAIHNHGHQIEDEFGFAANRQDGNSDLFWRKFVNVQNIAGTDTFVQGRCGDTDNPPNSTADYDYFNTTTTVNSDIEAWKPQGGTTKAINANRWFNMPYAWPNGLVVGDGDPLNNYDKAQAQWFIFWRQSM